MRSTSSIITRRRFRRRFPRRSAAAVLLCLCLIAPALATAAAPLSVRVAMVVPADMRIRPLELMDRDAVSLIDLVYESLIELDDSRMPVPSLATEWETGDGKTWKFKIRQGVIFHDGRELTAYDVKATMDLLATLAGDETRADNQKGLYALYPKMWKNWEVTGQYELTVRTDRPFYGLLYSMTFPVLQAQSAAGDNPPGTGPYRIASYMPGDELWLVGNQNWWKAPPNVHDITGVWYASENDALKAYDSESIDMMMTRSTIGIRYRGTASIRTNSYDYSTRQLETLVMNNYNSAKILTRDPLIRQAIACAIDEARLMANVYQGVVSQTDTLQSRESWLYNESTKVYGYNPEEAQRLLTAAKFDRVDDKGVRYKVTESGETRLSVRLNYYDEFGNALRKEAANEIADMLRAVGFSVDVSALSFDTAQERLKKANFDLFLCSYNFDLPPDPNFMLLSDGYGNYAYYRADDLNKLCQNLRKAYKSDDFRKYWFDIQAHVAENVPFLPLYWRGGVVLTRYAYSSVRDIREYELLKSIETYQ